MSVQAMSWVFTEVDDVTGNDLLTLLALANHADQYGECYPGIKRLGAEINCSGRTVQRALSELEAKGYVKVVAQGATDRRIPSNKRPNLYRLIRGDSSDTPEGLGVTAQTVRGDSPGSLGVTAVSPKPSLNHQEPSLPPLPSSKSVDVSRMKPVVVEAATLVAQQRLKARQINGPPVNNPELWVDGSRTKVLASDGKLLSDSHAQDPTLTAERLARRVFPDDFPKVTSTWKAEKPQSTLTPGEKAQKIRDIKAQLVSK